MPATPIDSIAVELLTLAEAAKVLRISRVTMYGLLRTRALDSLTIGRRRFITREQINRFCILRTQTSLPPGAERREAPVAPGQEGGGR
ncbi:MAG: helix-turn-helix domain-containing protein [Chloroflexales bacterium]|nr:helix-turn-helix domain-containing protein [Chloroflexales bacterium]